MHQQSAALGRHPGETKVLRRRYWSLLRVELPQSTETTADSLLSAIRAC